MSTRGTSFNRASFNQHDEGVLSVNPDGSYTVTRSGLNDEPKLVAYARVFLMLVNVLTTLGGFAITALGIYVYVQYNSTFSQFLSQQAAIGAIVAGILLAMIAFVGVYGAYNSSWKILLVYALISFALLVTILSVLGLFVDYINTVSQVATTSLVVLNERQAEVNDFFASAYTTCCVDNVKFCSSTPTSAEYCPPVYFCSAINQTFSNSSNPCYVEYYGANPPNPPQVVFQEFCGTLLGAGVVGPFTNATNTCGYPTGAGGFFKAVYNFVESNVQYPYICISLVSVIIFMEMVFSAIVIRHAYEVQYGTYENKSARNNITKEMSRRSPAATPTNHQDTFRFNFDDEFDASLEHGIRASRDMDSGELKTRSGRWMSSGNPVFKGIFKATKSKAKVKEEEDDDVPPPPPPGTLDD